MCNGNTLSVVPCEHICRQSVIAVVCPEYCLALILESMYQGNGTKYFLSGRNRLGRPEVDHSWLEVCGAVVRNRSTARCNESSIADRGRDLIANALKSWSVNQR